MSSESGRVASPADEAAKAETQGERGSASRNVVDVGCMSKPVTTDQVVQTDLSLPQRVRAFWHCCPQEMTIVESLQPERTIRVGNVQQDEVEEDDSGVDCMDIGNGQQFDAGQDDEVSVADPRPDSRAVDTAVPASPIDPISNEADIREVMMSPDQSRISDSRDRMWGTWSDTMFDYEHLERASPSDADPNESPIGSASERDEAEFSQPSSNDDSDEAEEVEISHRASSLRGDEPFDSCDIQREEYRLKELKLVSDGVRKIEDNDAKRARDDRLAGDRADDGRLIIRVGSTTGYTVAEAEEKWRAEKRARLKEESSEDPQSPTAETEDRPAMALSEDKPANSVRTTQKRVMGNKGRMRVLRMTRGITVDSGSADNVMPRRMVRGKNNKVRPSAASRAGVHYVSATSNRIPNEGETDLKFATKDGIQANWPFQIAEVNKVLASVSYMVDTGHRVVFDQDDVSGEDISFITNKKTGVSIKMRRDRQVWVVDAFVEEEIDEEDNAADFRRQD